MHILYRQIVEDNLLSLPSSKHLHRLSGDLSVTVGLPSSTISYLATRIKSLSSKDLLVSIIIDEVYSSSQIEFSGGKFYGFEHQEPTKTLLCFMIKSIAGRYNDVIAMVPLVKISSEIIKTWFDKVLEAVTNIGFDVVAVLTDAHSSNWKFYSQELCSGGKMKNFISNPHLPDNKIFLLFDSVHVFKNMYNNILNKQQFIAPRFLEKAAASQDEEKCAETTSAKVAAATTVSFLSAKFEHVQDLYNRELGHAVKYGHKLMDKVLAPQPIERTKVDLADQFFHENTI